MTLRPNAFMQTLIGQIMLPSVRATWRPRGYRPVLRHRFGSKRLSLAGALAFEPDSSDAHLIFEVRPGAYNDDLLIEQRSVLLIWDGPPSHHGRSRAIAT